MTTAGRLVRDARTRAGLSLRTLAGRAGTSDATLSCYETGAKDPRTQTLARVLAATGHELTTRPARSPSQRLLDLVCVDLAARVLDDPHVLELGRDALARLEGRSSWIDTWRSLLDAGPEAVAAVLTSTCPDADALKTDCPLALCGLIDDVRRAELVEASRAS